MNPGIKMMLSCIALTSILFILAGLQITVISKEFHLYAMFSAFWGIGGCPLLYLLWDKVKG